MLPLSFYITLFSTRFPTPWC